MHKLFSILIFIFIAVFAPQVNAAPTNELRLTAAQNAEAQRFGLTPEQWQKQNALIASLDSQVVSFSRANSVSLNTLRAIARELGMRNPQASMEQFLNALRAKAEDVAKLRTEITNLRRQIGELQNRELRTPAELAMNRAEAALDAGELIKAETELGNLEALRRAESSEARKLWEEAAARQASVAALRGDLDKSETILFAAKRQSREWAKEENLRAWRMMMQAGEQRYESGEKLGRNQDLEKAIAIYREEALPLVPRQQNPKEWAATEHRLGSVQQVLGYYLNDPQMLRSALTSCLAALEAINMKSAPVLWAELNNLLGIIFTLDMDYEGRLANEKALAAYQNSLLVYTKEKFPEEWAGVQVNLGNLYSLSNDKETGMPRHDKSVVAYRLALEVINVERDARRWAIVQQNLGNALFQLGTREAGIRFPSAALEAFTAAETAISRKDFPLDWAMIRANKARALFAISKETSNCNMARSAVDVLDEALSVFRSHNAAYMLEVFNDGNRYPRSWIEHFCPH